MRYEDYKMDKQISIDDLIKEKEPTKMMEIPKARDEKEKVYTIPGDVWEGRCQLCVHKNGAENVQITSWALHRPQYEEIKPCRILSIAKPHEKPGECMSFAPKMSVYGICETCRYNNIFCEGFCTKVDHAEQHRVYYGTHYGGDERKMDYYSRHRLSVCDDYEPDMYAEGKRSI